LINLFIDIRDTLDCITQLNLSSVLVIQNPTDINNFFTNPFIPLLTTGNQNIVTQILISLSQEFNQINIENIQNAVDSKYRNHPFFLSI
jgi:hypothetical protein